MPTRELTPTKVTVAPPSDSQASLYGPVEIAWYPDRLTITAVGAWRAAVAEAHPGARGEEVVIEMRPPGEDELGETLPGAD